MACNSWQEELVAHLYGELEPEQEQGVVAHLEACTDCRDSFEHLSSTRRWLQQSVPAVPFAPRVLVLQPRRSGWIAGALVTGSLSAALVFGLGLLARPWVAGEAPSLAPESRPDTSELLRGFRDRIETLNSRIDQLELQTAEEERSGRAAPATLTRSQLEQELQRVERRFQRERIRDLEYMLRAMTAAESRTDSWIDQTREALQLIAMRQEAGISEH